MFNIYEIMKSRRECFKGLCHKMDWTFVDMHRYRRPTVHVQYIGEVQDITLY